MQRFERRNLRRQQPDAGGERLPLVMDVDAEAAQVLAHEAQVHRFLLLQLLQLPRLEQRQHQAADILGLERRAGGRRQRAVDPQHRRRRSDQQDVGGVARRGGMQKLIERGGGLRNVRAAVDFVARRRAIQLCDQFGEFAVVGAHLRYHFLIETPDFLRHP